MTKNNRKITAAACLLLAFKFNEETHLSHSRECLKKLLRTLGVLVAGDSAVKDILRTEFEVYSALNFTLFLPMGSYESYFYHALSSKNLSLKNYLGERLAKLHLELKSLKQPS